MRNIVYLRNEAFFLLYLFQNIAKQMKSALSLFIFIALTSFVSAKNEIPLSGTWDFRLDPENQGIKESWWSQKLPDTIKLPGYLQAQGFGENQGLKQNLCSVK